jgi:hypothetical protein
MNFWTFEVFPGAENKRHELDVSLTTTL